MDRPRRATRVPDKFIQPSTPTPTPAKRKAAPASTDIRLLLTSPKSKLTSIQLSNLINAGSWNLLSSESQAHLTSLLPPTAFTTYTPTLDPDHPASASSSAPTQEPAADTPSNHVELNPALFTDLHFQAAAHTFQDHLYLGWLSGAHAQKVQKCQKAIQDGILAAPWKDVVWEKENASAGGSASVPAAIEDNANATGAAAAPALGNTSEAGARAGGASVIKLETLVKNNILRVGDVLVYKRNFQFLDLVIEKDCIIESIHPKSYHLTVFTQTGPTTSLPPSLLSPPTTTTTSSSSLEDPPPTTRSITISTPAALETALLDIDTRVERSKRPNGNAWKCFTVYRFRPGPNGEFPGGAGSTDLERGGRESHGTLFYLRGSWFHEH